MINLILSIVCTSYLFVGFRLFDKFKIDTFSAIVFNYLTCAITGSLFVPNSWTHFPQDISESWFFNAIIIGSLFIVNFNIIAYVTQKISITVSSVAGKMSFCFNGHFYLIISAFKLKSSDLIECVNMPTEIKSTPVSAIYTIVFFVIPPDASVNTFPEQS